MKEVIINLNGKTVKGVDNAGSWCPFTVNADTKLVINGNGHVDGGAGLTKNVCVTVIGGELEINGGLYTVGRDKDNDTNSVIYMKNEGGKIRINGGEFKTAKDILYNTSKPGGFWYYCVNVQNACVNPDIQITGGKFYGWDPETGDDKLGGNYVAEGYESYVAGTGLDMDGEECTIYGVRKK